MCTQYECVQYSLLCVRTRICEMQSANSKYGTRYLATRHVTFTFIIWNKEQTVVTQAQYLPGQHQLRLKRQCPHFFFRLVRTRFSTWLRFLWRSELSWVQRVLCSLLRAHIWNTHAHIYTFFFRSYSLAFLPLLRHLLERYSSDISSPFWKLDSDWLIDV